MTDLIAYHNDPQIKADILAQLAAHRAADELVKGQYWRNGKGCAVGCTLHSNDHAEYETRFGIPQMLAKLEDRIFEGMPDEQSQRWPERFMGAIEPGADLSCVGWKFLHWLLTDKSINPGIDHPDVADAVRQCADVLVPLTEGRPVDKAATKAAARAAAAAAMAADEVADEATRAAARAAVLAAWAAARAAARAARAARAAMAADEVAWAADEATRVAAWAAAWAAEAAGEAAYVKMADKLIDLIEEAA